jgi:hypothetical protein
MTVMARYEEFSTTFDSISALKKPSIFEGFFADRTGLEPATSAVTGRHSNQLNYRSFFYRVANISDFHFHKTNFHACKAASY